MEGMADQRPVMPPSIFRVFRGLGCSSLCQQLLNTGIIIGGYYSLYQGLLPVVEVGGYYNLY